MFHPPMPRPVDLLATALSLLLLACAGGGVSSSTSSDSSGGAGQTSAINQPGGGSLLPGSPNPGIVGLNVGQQFAITETPAMNSGGIVGTGAGGVTYAIGLTSEGEEKFRAGCQTLMDDMEKVHYPFAIRYAEGEEYYKRVLIIPNAQPNLQFYLVGCPDGEKLEFSKGLVAKSSIEMTMKVQFVYNLTETELDVGLYVQPGSDVSLGPLAAMVHDPLANPSFDACMFHETPGFPGSLECSLFFESSGLDRYLPKPNGFLENLIVYSLKPGEFITFTTDVIVHQAEVVPGSATATLPDVNL